MNSSFQVPLIHRAIALCPTRPRTRFKLIASKDLVPDFGRSFIWKSSPFQNTTSSSISQQGAPDYQPGVYHRARHSFSGGFISPLPLLSNL